MDERVIQFRVGIVVICAALIVGILIFLFGEGWSSQYTLYIQPKTAPGVTKNTPIRKNGILIGRVYEVESLDDAVRLTLKINSKEKIYENDVCEIGTASLLGDAVIDFLPGIENRGNVVEDGTMLATENIKIETNPLEMLEMGGRLEKSIQDTLISIKNAGDTVTAVGKDIKGFTSSINEAFNQEEGDAKQFFNRFAELSTKAETAITKFNKTMDSIEKIVGDDENQQNIAATIENVNRTAETLPGLINEATKVLEEASETVASFRDVGSEVESNLKNLKPFTEALGKDGPAITKQLAESMQGVDGLVVEINKLVGEVNQFVKSVNSSEGSLNRLITDPTLYNNINQTVKNVRDISTQLRPLIKDLRYVADGAARDPGQFGIRGALNRRPANTGYKGSTVGGDRVNYNQ